MVDENNEASEKENSSRMYCGGFDKPAAREHVVTKRDPSADAESIPCAPPAYVHPSSLPNASPTGSSPDGPRKGAVEAMVEEDTVAETSIVEEGLIVGVSKPLAFRFTEKVVVAIDNDECIGSWGTLPGLLFCCLCLPACCLELWNLIP
jgi:hypothetical protein